MWAAANTPGGVGGVSQKVGREFANADPGGHLPKYIGKRQAGGSAGADEGSDSFEMQQPGQLHFHIHLPEEHPLMLLSPDDYRPGGQADRQMFSVPNLNRAMPMPPPSRDAPPERGPVSIQGEGGAGKGAGPPQGTIMYRKGIQFQTGGTPGGSTGPEHILPGSPLGPPSGPQDYVYGRDDFDTAKYAQDRDIDPRLTLRPATTEGQRRDLVPGHMTPDRLSRIPSSPLYRNPIISDEPSHEAFGGGLQRIGGHEPHMSGPRGEGGMGGMGLQTHMPGMHMPSMHMAGLGRGIKLERGGEPYDDSDPRDWNQHMESRMRSPFSVGDDAIDRGVPRSQRENANEVYNPAPLLTEPPVLHRRDEGGGVYGPGYGPDQTAGINSRKIANEAEFPGGAPWRMQLKFNDAVSNLLRQELADKGFSGFEAGGEVDPVYRDRMGTAGRSNMQGGGAATSDLGSSLALERLNLREQLSGEAQAERGLSGTNYPAGAAKGSAFALVSAAPTMPGTAKAPPLGSFGGPGPYGVARTPEIKGEGVRMPQLYSKVGVPPAILKQLEPEATGGRIHDVPFHHGGVIGGAGAGRTDRLPLAVGVESHVIPADVVSALGQGTSDHGGNILWEALGGRDHPVSQPGHPVIEQHADHDATGGRPKSTSILAASGEFVVRPDQVQAIGERAVAQGMCKRGEPPVMCGHRLLDEMIARVRKFQIDWLLTAPPPKKSAGGAVSLAA